ncbi:MAG: ATP synthase F1 subunit gamma [Clostridia bacterium]|nr:ATP synthase F1 subunit gamma [Clostridia bacterium]
MADGAEIKARIASITETKKVTDAMYMISSVKMTRARREVEKTRPYFEGLKEEIAGLFRHIPETSNRYFRVPDPAEGAHLSHGVLLITSDKGLAGSYNHTVLSMCESIMSRHPRTVLFVVGEYGRRYFTSKKIPFVEAFRYSAEFPTVWKARLICADLLEYYDQGALDEINIVYTDYINGKPSECKRNVLLPLTRSRFATDQKDDTDGTEFFPDPDTVLGGVVPSYLTGFIYGCLVDSYCSEQQARMNAMSSAGKNAENMLSDLRRKYNSVRQAAITREMTEITSGSHTLKEKAAASADERRQ